MVAACKMEGGDGAGELRDGRDKRGRWSMAE